MPSTTTISLADIAVALSLGVPDSERARAQDVLISAVLALRDEGAPWRDQLSETVDYGDIIGREAEPRLRPVRWVEDVGEGPSLLPHPRPHPLRSGERARL
jgi:dihydroneopterin aldolase